MIPLAFPQIRDARAEDYDTFVRLYVELFAGVAGGGDPVPDFERWRAGILPTMMVAERAGAIVGYAHWRVLEGADGAARTVHLTHLVTAPEARRTGAGRALLEETVRRARAGGASELTLSVKPDNLPAVSLYESIGMRPISRFFSLRMPWTAILARPAPYLAAVRAPAPDEDAAIEQRHGFSPGTVSIHRKYADRMLRVIDPSASSDAGGSFGSFDVGFGGVSPFAIASVAHGLSLLHAFRPFARAEDDTVLLTLEDREDQTTELVAVGALLRFETTKLRVAL